MNLEQTLRTVATRLQNGLGGSREMQVRLTVIDPVLRALDWDTSDYETVRGEYRVNNGSVDYALLNNRRPLVFIEAKKVGALDARGEDQLFGYANNKGIPLLILTDGNIWDFYLSMAEGVPKERRFHQLQLSEDRIADHADFLETHLRRHCVVSGQARRSAEQMLAANREREEARLAIPRAYQTLLRKPDDMLCDLLAEAVKDTCGIQPNLDDVKNFLTRVRFPDVRNEPDRPSAEPFPAEPEEHQPGSDSIVISSRRSRRRKKLEGFSFDGKIVPVNSNIQALIKLVKAFDRRDSKFMERFFSETVTETRQLVARNPDDLYSSHSLKGKHRVNLENGWWLGTNISTKQIVQFVEIACKVANVKFGVDLKLIERE